jgi:Na+/H+-dicarboxylate symporter
MTKSKLSYFLGMIYVPIIIWLVSPGLANSLNVLGDFKSVTDIGLRSALIQIHFELFAIFVGLFAIFVGIVVSHLDNL